MKRKDFSILQDVYSILSMSLSRCNGLYIAGRIHDSHTPGDCIYQTVRTKDTDLISDANYILAHFKSMQE